MAEWKSILPFICLISFSFGGIHFKFFYFKNVACQNISYMNNKSEKAKMIVRQEYLCNKRKKKSKN